MTTAARTTTETKTKIDGRRRFAFALGANLGDAAATLTAAVGLLRQRFPELDVAPIYRTEPVSEIDQPDFLNTVVLGTTAEAPEELLSLALAIERRLGRRRRLRDAPREIDVDLLFVGDERRSTLGLTLPHPRFRARRFVLQPLADLAPDLPLPPDGATALELLARLPEAGRVERWPETPDR